MFKRRVIVKGSFCQCCNMRTCVFLSVSIVATNSYCTRKKKRNEIYVHSNIGDLPFHLLGNITVQTNELVCVYIRVHRNILRFGIKGLEPQILCIRTLHPKSNICRQKSEPKHQNRSRTG